MKPKLCRCGCGETVSRIWYSEECRARFRYAEGLSGGERRAYAKERLSRNARLRELPVHETIATVHRLDENSDERIMRQERVRIPTPRLGMFGL